MGKASVLLAETGSRNSSVRAAQRADTGQLLHEGQFVRGALCRNGREALVSVNVSPASHRGPLFIGAFFLRFAAWTPGHTQMG